MKIHDLDDRGGGDWFVVKVRTNETTAQGSLIAFVFMLIVVGIQAATGGPLTGPLIATAVAACLALLFCSISYREYASDVVVGVDASWLTIEHPNDKFGDDARIALEGPVEAQAEKYVTTFKAAKSKDLARHWGVVVGERQIFRGFETRAHAEQIVTRLNQALTSAT